MKKAKKRFIRFQCLSNTLLVLSIFLTTGIAAGQTADTGVRLYVLDGGVLESDPSRYELEDAEVASRELAISAYLIVHPRGVLLFDSLGIADSERIPDGTGQVQTIVRPDTQLRHVTLGESLQTQLESIGITADEVSYLAFSHLHWDHTANGNLFSQATWLVRPEEHTLMFSENPGGSARPGMYAALADSETRFIQTEEYDVFGDGTIILKAAPGHSPGHQVLFVRLENTGPVVISGDLYHYREERSLGRLPLGDMSRERTRQSRLEVESFLMRQGAELWIQHDLISHRERNWAPVFYD